MNLYFDSFDEILKARLAFDVYEMNALRNDKDNLQLILQTIRVNHTRRIRLNFFSFLQLCDYHISLLKLEHYLRHLDLTDIRVLHLCEYFDLLLLCNRDKTNLKSYVKKVEIAIFDFVFERD